MATRKLASIQLIKALNPIDGKDRIELATVLGWQVIVGKETYKVGDLVVYCEIDSQFPTAEWCLELEKTKYRIKTFTVNTPSGRVYSQGYCIPFDRFKEILDTCTSFWDDMEAGGFEGSSITWNEGDDVTKFLGITKYELPDTFTAGNALGKFPTHILPQTDEMRVQSVPDALEELSGLPYVIRTKIDGTSWSAGCIDEIPFVCSRSLSLKNPNDSGKACSYWDMFYKYNFDAIFQQYPHLAFQGEMYGEGIQKNLLGIKGKRLAIFNVYDTSERRRFNDEELVEITSRLHLEICPEIETGVSFNYTLEDLEKIAIHRYSNGSRAEGIVIRPAKEMWSPVLGSMLSFKYINPEFLIKKGE